MIISIDEDVLELDEEMGSFIKSVCILTDKKPIKLVYDLLEEYVRQVKKQMDIPRTN